MISASSLKKRLRNRRGAASLIEVLLAVVIFTGLAISVSYLYPNATHALIRLKARQSALSLANTQLQQTQVTPYLMVDPTPNGFFPNPNVCDCNQANFSLLPAGSTVTVGGVTFQEQTCVNWVSNNQPICPAVGVQDPGLKNVVVHVSWADSPGGLWTNSAQVSTQLNQSNSGQVISNVTTLTLSLCYDAGSGCSYSDHRLTDATKPIHVGVYNNLTLVTGTYGINPPGTPMQLQIPSGTNYTLQINGSTIFPFNRQGYMFQQGGVPYTLNIPVKDQAAYSTQYAGEAFIAAHPVISKVIGGVVSNPPGSCTGGPTQDLSEAIEIYNPTSNTYYIGPGAGTNQLTLASYNGAGLSSTQNFAAATFRTSSPMAVPPHGYLLIEGIDTSAHSGSNYPFNPSIQPDISYPITSLQMVYPNGGALQLLLNGTPVDSVRWGSSYPSGSGWVASPLPSGDLGPTAYIPGAPSSSSSSSSSSSGGCVGNAGQSCGVHCPGSVNSCTGVCTPGDPAGWGNSCGTCGSIGCSGLCNDPCSSSSSSSSSGCPNSGPPYYYCIVAGCCTGGCLDPTGNCGGPASSSSSSSSSSCGGPGNPCAQPYCPFSCQTMNSSGACTPPASCTLSCQVFDNSTCSCDDNCGPGAYCDPASNSCTTGSSASSSGPGICPGTPSCSGCSGCQQCIWNATCTAGVCANSYNQICQTCSGGVVQDACPCGEYCKGFGCAAGGSNPCPAETSSSSSSSPPSSSSSSSSSGNPCGSGLGTTCSICNGGVWENSGPNCVCSTALDPSYYNQPCNSCGSGTYLCDGSCSFPNPSCCTDSDCVGYSGSPCGYSCIAGTCQPTGNNTACGVGGLY